MRLLLISLSLFCLLLQGCAYNYARDNKPINIPCKCKNQLRVATYNLNSYDVPATKTTTNTVKKLHADVVFFQEVTPSADRCLYANLKTTYRYNKYYPYCKDGGLAIFSKYPFQQIDYFLPGGSKYPTWMVLLKTPYGPVQAVNLHLSPCIDTDKSILTFGRQILDTGQMRLNEIIQIMQHVSHHYDTILVGDFNENDTGAAVKATREAGYHDALLATPKCEYTYSKVFLWMNFAKRADRIFYYGCLHPERVQIASIGNSTHYPVIADFGFYKNHGARKKAAINQTHHQT